MRRREWLIVEGEDTIGTVNRAATSENVQWILHDTKTKKENKELQYKVKVDELKKVQFVNDPRSAHPMHVHGQRFVMLNVDGKQNEGLIWKDTVLVPAGSAVDVLIEFSNPEV